MPPRRRQRSSYSGASRARVRVWLGRWENRGTEMYAQRARRTFFRAQSELRTGSTSARLGSGPCFGRSHPRKFRTSSCGRTAQARFRNLFTSCPTAGRVPSRSSARTGRRLSSTLSCGHSRGTVEAFYFSFARFVRFCAEGFTDGSQMQMTVHHQRRTDGLGVPSL